MANKVVLDHAGIQELLRSVEMQEGLEKLAKELAADVNDIDPEGEWKTAIHMRPSRATALVYTDDEDAKWREVSSGKIAKKIRQRTRKGKRLSDDS